MLALIFCCTEYGHAADKPASQPASSTPPSGLNPATRPVDAAAPQITIETASEMKNIPETSWPAVDTKDSVEVMAPALLAWNQGRPAVEKAITPELVRSLSQWAVQQMAGYQKVPALDHLQFELAGESKDSQEILLETTIDTLPSHSPLVTRWLKLYLVCDKSSGRIVRAIITIRGQVLE